jgi:hypothetical protein
MTKISQLEREVGWCAVISRCQPTMTLDWKGKWVGVQSSRMRLLLEYASDVGLR